MDQTNAQVGQEEAPQGQINTKGTEERPAANTGSMEKLLQEEGLNLDFPKQGEIRTGVIASIGDNEILVSVGTKSEGVISGKEKEQIPPEALASFQIGQEIPVYVLNPEDPSGNLVLSYNRAREENDWLEAEKMKELGEAYDGTVIGYNKGGLIVPLGMLRGFVPASQVSVMRRAENEESVDARWNKMVGEPIKVAVIEVDRARHRLILSERLALQETRETIKDRLLDELQEGAVKTGRVTSLADFGAFVNIDGADGLVHLSEISWERIEHPSEVLKVGQEVKVKVIAVDQERKRIGLSIRQLQPDPWVVKVSNIKEGQLVEGTITHLTKFGAFARLDEDLEGLIHISELSDQRINHPKEVVKEGDVVTLRVIKIDSERRRIGLSLRKVDSMAYANLDYEMMLSGQSKTEAKPVEEETAVLETVAVDIVSAGEEPVADKEAPVAEEPPTTEEASAEAEAQKSEEIPAEETLITEAEPTSAEAPVEEASVVEEPSAEAETQKSKEEPVVETSIAEVEPNSAEAPVEEASVAEEPSAEAETQKRKEEPAVETSIAEAEPTSAAAPVEEASVVEEPSAEAETQKSKEEPAVETSIAEEQPTSADAMIGEGASTSEEASESSPEGEASATPEAEIAPKAEDEAKSD
ncbi:MAG: S1 RNA-binding domain-containing protein [Anaerolineales bacterium]